MQVQISQDKLREIRLCHIIDMGLSFSGMMRLFEQGSKRKLHEEIIASIDKVFEVQSQEDFDRIHADFCESVPKIKLAKKTNYASYGQIAKTFNVVFKVVVYYSHFPDHEKSKRLSNWLHAAVDRKMMAMLKRRYPKDIQVWPTLIEEVTKEQYEKIRQTVAKFIREEYNGSIVPVEFDDVYFGGGKYSW